MKKIMLMGFLFTALLFNGNQVTEIYAADEVTLEEIISEVDDTNDEINAMILAAQLEAQKEIDKSIMKITYILESSNRTEDKKQFVIDLINAKLDSKINSIIEKLIEDTNTVAQDMFDRASEAGFIVICELELVTIGDEQVWIDPLKVPSF